MRKALLLCGLLVLALAPFANSQELAATKLYNLVDTPASITYSASGQAMVQLDPTSGSTISLAGYRKIHIRIGTAKATSFMINMGKISNATLSQMTTLPINQTIRTFDVKGPEMVLWLTGGPPNTADKVQLWVYLSS